MYIVAVFIVNCRVGCTIALKKICDSAKLSNFLAPKVNTANIEYIFFCGCYKE